MDRAVAMRLDPKMDLVLKAVPREFRPQSLSGQFFLLDVTVIAAQAGAP